MIPIASARGGRGGGGILVVVFGERRGVELSMKGIRVETVPTHKKEPIKLVLW